MYDHWRGAYIIVKALTLQIHTIYSGVIEGFCLASGEPWPPLIPWLPHYITRHLSIHALEEASKLPKVTLASSMLTRKLKNYIKNVEHPS